jgi:hypothetical protein
VIISFLLEVNGLVAVEIHRLRKTLVAGLFMLVEFPVHALLAIIRK